MQQVLRPCVGTGIAVVGAGVIAITPITPALTDVHVSAIRLTTGSAVLGDAAGLAGSVLSGPSGFASDVITPYVDIFTNTFADLEAIAAGRLADPAPILSAVLDNQVGYLQQVLADPASIVNVPGEMAQHAENVLITLTNFLTMNPDMTTSPPTLDVMLGVPMALLVGGASPLVAPVKAAGEIVAGLTSGNPATALAALIDAPATLINDVIAGFLRPTLDISTTISADQIAQWNTALAGLGQPTLTVTTYDGTIGGIGGLVDTLVNHVPQQIGAAIAGQPQPEIIVNPVVAFLSILSGGGLTVPSTMAAEVASQLPALLDPFSFIPF